MGADSWTDQHMAPLFSEMALGIRREKLRPGGNQAAYARQAKLSPVEMAGKHHIRAPGCVGIKIKRVMGQKDLKRTGFS